MIFASVIANTIKLSDDIFKIVYELLSICKDMLASKPADRKEGQMADNAYNALTAMKNVDKVEFSKARENNMKTDQDCW